MGYLIPNFQRIYFQPNPQSVINSSTRCAFLYRSTHKDIWQCMRFCLYRAIKAKASYLKIFKDIWQCMSFCLYWAIKAKARRGYFRPRGKKRAKMIWRVMGKSSQAELRLAACCKLDAGADFKIKAISRRSWLVVCLFKIMKTATSF